MRQTEQLNIRLSGPLRALAEQQMALLHDAPLTPYLAQAYDEGRSCSFDEAVALALILLETTMQEPCP
ncbi:hypothetical protein HC891_15155 [Candidatus Gracilibacteria bacterium]|nr:hypothetical protein [Candidatus Gracilibacteria bacterium]